MSPRRPVAASLVALAIAAACGAPSNPVAPETAMSSPSPSPSAPSAVPSTAPSSSPSGPSAAGVVDLPADSVPAGTYAGPGFKPTTTLTVDDGWQGTVLNGFFDIQQRRGTPEVVAVQVANVVGVLGADGAAVVPEDAAAAAELVASNPGLVVLGQSDSQLGGLTGRVVEVRNERGAHTQIMDVPPGRLGIDDARALWIAFLDTPAGEVMAVMVGGPTAGWEDALALAERVLESIRIGD